MIRGSFYARPLKRFEIIIVAQTCLDHYSITHPSPPDAPVPCSPRVLSGPFRFALIALCVPNKMTLGVYRIVVEWTLVP